MVQSVCSLASSKCWARLTDSRSIPSGEGSTPSSRIQRARASTRFPPALSPIRTTLGRRIAGCIMPVSSCVSLDESLPLGDEGVGTASLRTSRTSFERCVVSPLQFPIFSSELITSEHEVDREGWDRTPWMPIESMPSSVGDEAVWVW